MIIKMPENCKIILDTIHNAGYEAYIVGGCVRDALLGIEPKDWDITTNATPSDIKQLFKRTIDTGIEHGTVTVMIGKQGYEITTYRIDGKYEDHRHPREVTFTRDLTEDMKRRDFTINAMAYNEEEGLIDRFGGIKDLKDHIIRCVGNPLERFSEDALRMMRAVRFSAQLDYEIEQGTREAIKELADSLKKISAERIQQELVKLLVSDNPGRLRCAYELGITKIILPEFDACMETRQENIHHRYSVGEHIVVSIENVRADRILRLTMLMHDLGKPSTLSTDEDGTTHFYGHEEKSTQIARDILKRLKFDRDTTDRVCNLVRYHDVRFPATGKSVRRAIHMIGERDFPYLFDIRYADTMAQSEYMRDEKLKLIEDCRRVYQQVLDNGDCVSLRTLAVGGRDLIELGVKPGKKLGEILDKMLKDVLDEPGHNTREYLLDKDRLNKRFMK